MPLRVITSANGSWRECTAAGPSAPLQTLLPQTLQQRTGDRSVVEAARGGSRCCAMDGSGTGAECAVRSGGPPSSGADVADSGRALGAELATCSLACSSWL